MKTDTTVCKNCGDECDAKRADNTIDTHHGTEGGIEWLSPCCQSEVITQEDYEERQANEPDDAKEYVDRRLKTTGPITNQLTVASEMRTSFRRGYITAMQESRAILV